MAYEKVAVKKKPGPQASKEAGKTYRVYIKPSVFGRITKKHKTLSNALKHLDALENKKDKPDKK